MRKGLNPELFDGFMLLHSWESGGIHGYDTAFLYYSLFLGFASPLLLPVISPSLEKLFYLITLLLDFFSSVSSADAAWRILKSEIPKLLMASTSCASKSLLTMKEAVPVPASSFRAYPAPLAKYEEVSENPKVFMFTLEKLHAEMGTKFMIPIIGGRELDLHRLFVEVTSRGGIEKIIRDRKWKEVTSVFNFPSTATNASFVLRKYYASLLFHYERIYYFKAPGFTPTNSDALSSQSTMAVPAPKVQLLQSQLGIQSPAFQQSSFNAAGLPEAVAASSAGSAVIGVIDGKFESGYLVTVTIGSEKLKGVLYQAPQNTSFSASHPSVSVNNKVPAPLGVRRRRRRKKSEIKRRDPAHPKPNRSGYNFFFAEQHARLKSLHQGKDRDISRVIGDLWNKLNESEKTVYQEKALKDKERYRAEMEDYREKQKMGIVISDAVPLQQRLPEPDDTDMVDADIRLDEAEADSLQTPEESSSGESDYEDDKATEKDFNMGASHVVLGEGAESSYLGSEK
ncbi:hypothetical protein RIF29_22946 [Crotalaria pallida]|uniref:High mobility group B protein 15 n=1 Tax=Crotalaria pallida TaxID=3830 RepID=A0AAN9F513_CROPI